MSQILKIKNFSAELKKFETISAIIAGLIGLAWFGIILNIKLRLYEAFAYRGDLAYYSNILFNTNLNYFLYADFNLIRYNQTTFLNEHFAPTLALLAPLYQCFNTPAFLLVVQAGALTVAGYLIYLISRTLIKQKEQDLPPLKILPLIFQLMFLLHPAIIKATVDLPYGFHHDSLVPMFLFLTVLSAIKGRLALGLVFWGLLLGLKENLPILGMALCLTLWIFKVLPGRTVFAAFLLCLFFFSGSIFFQHLTGNRHVAVIYQLLSLSTLHDLVVNLGDKWEFLLLYVPAFFSPLIWIPFAGELVLQLVGKSVPWTWRIYTIMAILNVGFVYGVVNSFKNISRKIPFLFFVFFCIATSIESGITSLREEYNNSQTKKSLVAFKEDLKILAENIPQDARLAATSDLLVFLSNRKHLRWQGQLSGVQYIMVSGISQSQKDHELKLNVKEMTAEGKLCKIASRGMLTLYLAKGSGLNI